MNQGPYDFVYYGDIVGLKCDQLQDITYKTLEIWYRTGQYAIYAIITEGTSCWFSLRIWTIPVR